jgi:pyruvate/2-oxoglutarate dehydrogenase complex dihydrolipoamide acyltransferase (E2) component
VSGISRRADWVALPLAAIAGAATAATPAPTKAPAPAAVTAAHMAPAAPAAAPAPASMDKPAPAAAPRARDAAFADEIEQRLIILKRLRDKGLISEEEYQQKRKEVLQLL